MMTSPDLLRTKQINLKLSEEEEQRLEALARHLSLTPQSVLRMMLKRASDEFGLHGRWPVEGAAPSTPKKTRRK